MRKILKADGSREAKNGLRANGGGAAVGARGVGPAVDHGVTDFNAGGIAVENDAADLVSQNLEQVGKFDQVFLGAVNGGGEMAVETASGIEKFLMFGETDQ